MMKLRERTIFSIGQAAREMAEEQWHAQNGRLLHFRQGSAARLERALGRRLPVETLLHHIGHGLLEQFHVFVVAQPIGVDSVGLVDPQPEQLQRRSHRFGCA